MNRYTEFDKTIHGVDVTVKASIDEDCEFDEFTVYVGDAIITEILSDDVVEQLKESASDEVSDDNIALCRADDEYKEKGE